MSSIVPATEDHEGSSLPPISLINSAHTQLSIALRSSKCTTRVKCKPPLILYCPIEGGESVIDATVQELARRSNATLKTIDIAQLIAEQPHSFCTDESTSDDEENESDSASTSNKWGYFNMRNPISATKLAELAKNAIEKDDATPESDSAPGSDRCIVYLRDFGFLATFAPECYAKILSTIHECRCEGETNDQTTNIATAVILGASPLLTEESLFQIELPEAETSTSLEGGLKSFLESLGSEQQSNSDDDINAWGEGEDAEKIRDKRLRLQHELWKSGALTDHIHDSLVQTQVFGEGRYIRGRWIKPECLPTRVMAPARRNSQQERLAREKRRFELNRCQAQMALLANGGELQAPPFDDTTDDVALRFKEALIEFEVIERVASQAMGNALASSNSCDSALVSISWEEYCAAWKEQQKSDQECTSWLEGFIPTETAEPKAAENDAIENLTEKGSGTEGNTKDVVVEWVKQQELNVYQEIVLNRLVHPADMATGFDSVHLPQATIDTIRTLVSLRLVYPKGFHSGILKQYSMSGALLFGPPGTGKTHLVKAIAKESGARMISIRPTDIMDNCPIGKVVETLFEVARLLKPCIIFIDEMDGLFGARVSNDDGYSRLRTDMLTQFAQEMDGMFSSDVIVIGASNHPSNIDDAIIRRLPCRILVDLPDKHAREAILRILLKDEQLESDVDLMDLATLTPNFSGSDLKHVCVTAAYESVKELANISWTDKKPSLVAPVLGKAHLNSTSNAESNLESQTRKLAKRHFTQALAQIRASTSETQTSLIELRRWNNEFGTSNLPSSIEGDTEEEVIERVRRQGLSEFQEKVLSCVIRSADITTGFDSVHLPYATIDAMRTLVSLRLVCPQAFQSGILKEYNMSGALLFGPPGTGKTHLVKAIAKEAGVRMLSVKPSDIMEKWVGETEKTIDALFEVARRLKPCVLFIDEIDTLFGSRRSAKDSNSPWRNDMLSQFAQEMDGMRSSDVIVIGATNRPFDLDDAVIRRLPCRILVDLPDKDAREAILRILLKDEKLAADVDLAELANLTPKFSGSDLKHVCVTAAFDSAKELANISWTDKKDKRTSVTPPLGIPSPAASASGRNSPASEESGNGLAELSSLPNGDSAQSTSPQTRELAKRHFTQALKQIRASTSEAQSSLAELRRWNDQFGSGGQSSKTGAYGVSGLNFSGSNRPWATGSGAGGSGTESRGSYLSSLRSGKVGTGASTTVTSSTGAGTSGGNSTGVGYNPPVEGSYLRSLGIQL